MRERMEEGGREVKKGEIYCVWVCGCVGVRNGASGWVRMRVGLRLRRWSL